MIRALALGIGVMFLSQSAWAVECRTTEYADTAFTLCEVDATSEQIDLFLKDDSGNVYGQFFAVDRALAATGKRLGFAMNAGMYHDDRAPVGHYLENGQEQMRVISNPGPGNFGMLPNGVFCIRKSRADVIETLNYLETAPACIHATQSGPMLVTDGALHPRFLKGGTSKYIRNGVGTTRDGLRVVFAISEEPVNFYTFGNLFKEHLDLPNALYFDGNVSRIYAPDINRNDIGFQLGPIVGVVENIEP